MFPATLLKKKKRKQRSPFYTNVFKDTNKEKRNAGKKGGKIWCLIKITRTETGQTREREYYATLREAKDAQERALALNRKEGLDAVEIRPELRAEAIKAAAILKGKATLIQAADYYMSHAAPKKKITVLQLYQNYYDFQKAEGAAGSYLKDIKWRLRRFAESFPASKKAHEVTYHQITNYIGQAFVRQGKEGQKRIKRQKPRKLSPAGRKIELKNIRPMFNFALDQGYIQKSPFPVTHFLQRKSKDRQNLLNIRVLTLDEVKAVLQNAGPLLPYHAFGLFLGTRPDETKALDWSNVTWRAKSVLVNGTDSTSHDRRHVPMSENLLAWLKPYKKRKKGPVVEEKGFRDRFIAVAQAAGLVPWPSDVLRHTFASYWLAKFKDEATLKFLMGHHLSSAVLRKHYLNLVTPEDAEKFWAIFPS